MTTREYARASWATFKIWWGTKAWPAFGRVADEWWIDIGEKPRPHFVSMFAGIVIYLAIKLAVTLAL